MKSAGGLGASKDDMQTSAQVPYMHGTATAFRIKHREYIGDVIGKQDFENSTFIVNPENATTFPWLSSIAGSFEQYRFKGLCFEYVPTCGDALSASDNALGTVILAMNYNAADTAAATKSELMQQMWARSGKPSVPHLMPVECASVHTPSTPLYTSPSDPAGYDPRLYNMGFLQVGVQGMQVDDINVGELWVTYDVELYKPQNIPAAQGGVAHFTGTTGASSLVTMFPTETENEISISLASNNLIFGLSGDYTVIVANSSANGAGWGFADQGAAGGISTASIINCLDQNTTGVRNPSAATTKAFVYFVSATAGQYLQLTPNAGTGGGGQAGDLDLIIIKAAPAV